VRRLIRRQNVRVDVDLRDNMLEVLRRGAWGEGGEYGLDPNGGWVGPWRSRRRLSGSAGERAGVRPGEGQGTESRILVAMVAERFKGADVRFTVMRLHPRVGPLH
jgi:hypothetical protein